MQKKKNLLYNNILLSSLTPKMEGHLTVAHHGHKFNSKNQSRTIKCSKVNKFKNSHSIEQIRVEIKLK